jgi:amidase/6-aminohexanoate-cyclic-dimer hydrolase
MIAEYDKLDSVAMADLVRSGEIRAEELLDEAMRRTEARDGILNSVTARFYDHARARIAQGLPDGPLRGVPYLLKDLGVYYAGFPTTNASRLFADNRSPVDSTLADRYVKAGLVIFGKTNLSEFGISATSESEMLGVCRNPWSLEHTTGGSSGGATSAVAGGIIPSAHAADGGGSIRIPAAHCGLFGLKPTRGRIPLGPHISESWAGMTIHHAVTRSVRDSALLLDISQGAAPGDPYWPPPAAPSYFDLVAREPKRLKVAVSLKSFEGVALDPQVREGVERAAKLCESLGHAVEWIDLDTVVSAEEYIQCRSNIIHGSMYTSLSRRKQQLGQEWGPKDLQRVTWMFGEAGKSVTAKDYLSSVQALQRVSRGVGEQFEHWDVLLSPVCATPPHRLGEVNMDATELEPYKATARQHTGYTSIWNVTGQPAMSVPLHWSEEGLPVGVQFVGRFGDEATLFQLGGQLERAAPWFDRLPTAHLR